MGIEIELPIRAALMCAGISSGPSQVCWRNGRFSGTNLLKMLSKSTLTSGSALSLIVIAAEVCFMKR